MKGKKRKSNHRSARPRAENPIQKTSELLRKAKSKPSMTRVAADRHDEAMMAQHAKSVREAGESCVVGIIETGRRLLRAKAEISHGGWKVFVEKHLRWAHSSVTAFMRIGRAFEDQSADIVSALPGDQRSLNDLARLPAQKLRELLKRHGGSLSDVPRPLLRQDIRNLLPSRASSTATRPTKATAIIRAARADGPQLLAGADGDPAFNDPVWVAGNLLSLISERGFTLTDDERSLVLEKLDEIRVELEASAAVTVDVDVESPATDEGEMVAAQVDAENDKAELDRDAAAREEGESVVEDHPGDEEEPARSGRYRRLKDCVPLTLEELATLKPSADDVVARRSDGCPYLRRRGVDSTESTVLENAPAPVKSGARTAPPTPRRLTLKIAPSARNSAPSNGKTDVVPSRRRAAR